MKNIDKMKDNIMSLFVELYPQSLLNILLDMVILKELEIKMFLVF